MKHGAALLLSFGCLTTLSVGTLADGPAAVPASPSEHRALERFLTDIDRPPMAYQARRRLEASSVKLNESAWMEAITEYDPRNGFRYHIAAEGGSERIRRRVLRKVLEAERENSERDEWRKGILSHDNYAFDFGGRTEDGLLQMRLTPRRRDSRLVLGSALLSAHSGTLVRIEGQLSKSPSIWVRRVHVSRSYAPVRDTMMLVAIESTADVRIAGTSTFSMTYDYQMVNGHAVNLAPKMLAAR
jgi:hypothetical protein